VRTGLALKNLGIAYLRPERIVGAYEARTRPAAGPAWQSMHPDHLRDSWVQVLGVLLGLPDPTQKSLRRKGAMLALLDKELTDGEAPGL